MSARSPTCRRCSAPLEYSPGANTTLVCRFCGEHNPIAQESAAPARTASSYRELVEASFASHPAETVQTIACSACGARTTRPANVLSDRCPFCEGATVSAGGTSQRSPDGILPFVLDEAKARAEVAAWARALWFKPAPLFPAGGPPPPTFHALYLPYWSFDWDVTAEYVGSDSSKNAQEKRGVIRKRLSGLTILASTSVPTAIGADLEPWDLDRIVAPRPELLAGIRAETHGEHEGLARGADLAHRLLERDLDVEIEQQIGGDRPTLTSKSLSYHAVSFRLLLLPVWSTSFRHGDRSFRVLVNARNGEVVGERPVSAPRLIGAFVAPFVAPFVIGTVVAVASSGQRTTAFLIALWATLAAQSVVLLGVASGGRDAGPERHGQFTWRRSSRRGDVNFAEMSSGVMQNDPRCRRELLRAVGTVGVVISVFPLLSTSLTRVATFPVALVVAFHVFGALAVLAFVLRWRESVVEKRHLLGLDDRERPSPRSWSSGRV